MDRDFWKDEARLDRVRKLYVERGMSAAEIAESVGHGVSRSSIIGLAHRQGWTKKARQTPSNPALKAPVVKRDRQPGAVNARGNRRPRPVDNLSPAEFAKQQATRDKFEAEGKARIALVETAANDSCLRLIDRRVFQCAWPVGVPLRPADQMCCGEPVPTDIPRAAPAYCPTHSRMALSKQQPARKVPTEPSIRRRAA